MRALCEEDNADLNKKLSSLFDIIQELRFDRYD